MKTADTILEEAAETFREKGKLYGQNYLNIGKALEALFPNGVTIKTAHDWNRLHLFMLSMVKTSRYANNWPKGHLDTIHDQTVYSAMLESLDRAGP